MTNNHKPTKEEIDKVRLRTDEIRDIIGIVPKWFVRYGISVIFIILLIIIIGCWFFKYPDVVSARVDITANNLPVSVVARSDGRLEKILVKDNQLVKSNEILAVIESAANYEEVFKLKSVIDSLGDFLIPTDFFNKSILFNFANLGTIQPFYSSFIKQLKDYSNFIVLDYHNKKIAGINAEIIQQKNYINKLNARLLYSEGQLSIAQKQYTRDSLLYSNRVIALADLEKSQDSYLHVKGNYELAKTEIIVIDLQITKLNQSILDLASEKLGKSSQIHNLLKESLDILLLHIANWEKSYVLKSSTNGTITFTRIWNDNQNLKAGEIVFTIIPSGSLSYIAKVYLPIQSSGKVKPGQKIIIKLDDFPFMEYGLLYGNISKISLIPENEFYFAEVVLPSKLITSYGTDISMKNEYKGTGEIITRNQRLIYKFINPLRSLWETNKLKQ
jgi:HlyD family secretion protein